VTSGLRVIVEADGGSRGNPGPAGYGAVVFDAETHTVLAERAEAIGVDTNNVAEYSGLIAGLQAAKELGATSVAVRMDSKLVIEQMSGRWQVKHPSMRPLAKQASALLAGFDDVTLEWIPRLQNAHADRLANQAMDLAAGRPVKATGGATLAVEPVQPTLSWGPPEGDPTRLILVRHGRTAHTPAKLFSGRNDEPLDAEGERQAHALANRLARWNRADEIAAVVSSPLPRTMHTAREIASALGRPVVEYPDLAEADFGAWEGRAGAEVREIWPDEYAAWITTSGGAPPGGESFDEVARRARRARDELIRSYPGENVVVVSHVTPIKSLLRLALDAPQSVLVRLHLDTASISKISYFPDGSASVGLFNDTAHLEFSGS
jgi:broad specificity phosphatase PhoE/ribonuclease HI